MPTFCLAAAIDLCDSNRRQSFPFSWFHRLKGLAFDCFANPTHKRDCLELCEQSCAFRILNRNRKAERLVLNLDHVEEISVSIVREAGLVVAADNCFQVVVHVLPFTEHGPCRSINRSSRGYSARRSRTHLRPHLPISRNTSWAKCNLPVQPASRAINYVEWRGTTAGATGFQLITSTLVSHSNLDKCHNLHRGQKWAMSP